MDEEQIKALINTSLEAVKTEILGAVDQKNSGAVASMKREFGKALEPITTQIGELAKQSPTDEPPKDGDAGNLSLKALQQELNTVREQLDAEKQQRQTQADAAIASEKKALLSGAIARRGLINGGVLQSALEQRWGGKLTKDGDGWFVQDGDDVKAFDAAFNEFVASDDGKVFLPPSGTSGAGGNEGSGSSGAGGTPASAQEALMAAFG